MEIHVLKEGLFRVSVSVWKDVSKAWGKYCNYRFTIFRQFADVLWSINKPTTPWKDLSKAWGKYCNYRFTIFRQFADVLWSINKPSSPQTDPEA